MSELGWRFFSWMTPRRWRFFFWITPRWLSRKFQVYMLRRIVERYPAEVDRDLRESARTMAQQSGEMAQQFGTTGWSEEELVALHKQSLDLILHPQARKRRFSQIGPHR